MSGERHGSLRGEGSGEPSPRSSAIREWGPPAAAALALSLLASLVLVRAHQPPEVFPKYAAIAAAPAEAGRAGDVSPLYLGLTRLLAPFGLRFVLELQCVLQGVTAALLAAAATRLGGRRAGFLAAGLAALHAPFLVAAGTHEPESMLQFVLAAAILLGLLAGETASSRTALLTGGIAGACLGAAALLRPQQLLLLPAWSAWLASRSPRGSRLLAAAAPLLGAALALAPALVPRLASGVPATMNPGVVLYEGNWPAATGLARYAPALVKELEARHPERFDYGHVAYRRLAAFAEGRAVETGENNRWWLRLLSEGVRAEPGRFLARLARKALFAVAPYEIHDLRSMESLSRRARALLPWGFFALAAGLVWIPLAGRERLRQLAGPLAVAALAVAVQVAFYASARQRLPLATAACVITPVLLSDALAGRLRGTRRAALAVALGLASALGLAWATGRTAAVDQAQWDVAGAAPARSLGEGLAAVADGRRLVAPRQRELASAVVADIATVQDGGSPPRRLAALRGRALDFTVDDLTVLVPELWLARAAADPAERRALAAQALAARPGDPAVLALALAAAERPPADPATALALRPPGCDPASWLWLLGRESGDPRLLAPLAEAFPELVAK